MLVVADCFEVDFFRHSPHRPPPLACFLSHVHSDHLAGLESLRSPFVYCSAATREILLRLERYPCRINYAKGILEARVQTFKNLKSLLKPIPLETPTRLELTPGNVIQVTLLDANHCPGAVMFLIEGRGKAVLYTGDVRSEPWFVNSIARKPSLIEYSSGLKILDKIYLDTSFLENIHFQTKAEGITELLQKIAIYPPDTIFHFQAWTYGYEEIWIALSKALQSQIHVDDYKMRIFRSLRSSSPGDRSGLSSYLCPEAPALTGYVCGNTEHPGCLTLDENVRIHSCERGNYCSVVQKGPVVRIQPVVAHRANGGDYAEAGVGGGGEDLEREVELYNPSPEDLQALREALSNSSDAAGNQQLYADVDDFLQKAAARSRNIPLALQKSAFGDTGETTLENAVSSIVKLAQLHRRDAEPTVVDPAQAAAVNTITFPFSRHSSYPELCSLLEAFKPKDVWPCTVDPYEWHQKGRSIESLFGHCCSGSVFDHDLQRKHWLPPRILTQHEAAERSKVYYERVTGGTVEPEKSSQTSLSWREQASQAHMAIINDASTASNSELATTSLPGGGNGESQASIDSQLSVVNQLSHRASSIRADAYAAMMRNLSGEDWTPVGLISVNDHHTFIEQDPDWVL